MSRVVCKGQQSNRQMSAPPLVFQGNIAPTHPTGDRLYSVFKYMETTDK